MEHSITTKDLYIVKLQKKQYNIQLQIRFIQYIIMVQYCHKKEVIFFMKQKHQFVKYFGQVVIALEFYILDYIKVIIMKYIQDYSI
jgi:hypothetical protein